MAWIQYLSICDYLLQQIANSLNFISNAPVSVSWKIIAVVVKAIASQISFYLFLISAFGNTVFSHHIEYYAHNFFTSLYNLIFNFPQVTKYILSPHESFPTKWLQLISILLICWFIIYLITSYVVVYTQDPCITIMQHSIDL